MKDVLLNVKNLSVKFKTLEGNQTAIEGNSFSVYKGEVFCLVGESGCGKSLTSLSIMGLVLKPGIVHADEILLDGQDISKMKERQLRQLRGNKMSMIFQEPLTSLNPLFTVGNQMDEVFRLHQKAGKAQARQMSIEMLRFVGIPDPENVYKRYPAALSGGMRQRVMIAMALSCKPSLLIADEPTTALDVNIQKKFLRLMQNLRRELDTSIILITHDLSVVAEMADRVAVMYAGEIIEQASVYDLFRQPLHPYTQGLINSTIKLGDTRDRLPTIPGTVPPLTNMPEGCHFHPRCPYATNACRTQKPSMVHREEGHMVRCLRYVSQTQPKGGADT